MAKIDKTVHKLYKEILTNGFKYEDPNRKGVHRLQIPSYQIVHNFTDGFPAITTKKLAWKSVVGETLWILRGQTNIKYLEDNNIPIWRGDAYNYAKIKCNYNKSLEEFVLDVKKGNKFMGYTHKLGDLGKVYGYQLRSFGGEFDQLKWIIDTMKNNPLATKKTVTYINPNDKEYQALSPCHTGFKILVEPIKAKDILNYLENNGGWHLVNMNNNQLGFNKSSSDEVIIKYFKNIPKCEKIHFKNFNIPKYQFTLQWEQDSVDTFLGLSFNIGSYALLAYIIGKLTNMVPKGIVGDLGNVHIYEPHLDAVKEQLSRSVNTHPNCQLDDFGGFKMDMRGDIDQWLSSKEISDFTLSQYSSDPRIPAEMLAYNK